MSVKEIEPPKKKLRVDLMDNNSSSPNTLDVDLVVECTKPSVEFPSLAFTVFIETAEVNVLKLCRLVCRSWNDAATSTLRNRSYVNLVESNGSRSEEFRALLVNRSIGTSCLPSPYQNFKVVASSFVDEGFNHLINMPNVVATSFHLLFSRTGGLYQNRLGSFLVSKGNKIKQLQVNATAHRYREFELNTSFLANEHIRLPVLKQVVFEDHCSQDCVHSKLLNKLIEHASLEDIELAVIDMNKVVQMLTADALKTVVSLILRFGTLGDVEFSTLGTLEISGLKTMKVFSRHRDHAIPAEQTQQFALLVEKVSSTLKVLGSNFIKLEQLPPCPKLEDILVYEFNDKISEFSLAKFPSLKSIAIKYMKATRKCMEDSFVPHTGVQDVVVDVAGSESERKAFARDHLHIFLTNLSRQFPNTRRLTLNIEPFNSVTFRSIHRAFPDITHLKIGSQCDFFSISGMQMEVINEYLEAGWPTERIPRKDSIFDFQGLRGVILDLKFRATNDMIIYCFAKLPALKDLTFYWNDGLSVQNIRDCLGHLKTIKIFKASTILTGTDLHCLKSLPNVILV